jgi:GDPmannose 4,6-dehydratase
VKAVITGAGGQDGSYLAELLLERGYDVVGIVPQLDVPYENLAAARDRSELLQADLLDEHALAHVLREHGPREVYNLASPSFVPMSWHEPVRTAEFAAVGVTALLEAIRAVDPSIRMYQASSSEIFGEPTVVPQTEETPLHPVTPYGVAKAYGHFIVGSYRRRYGLHASCGILYNHESPRRPTDFVPSKIAHAAAAISLGIEHELALGDVNAQRDWGYARDYVDAMWRMLQQDEPGDYVLASGVGRTVAEFARAAFACVGLEAERYLRVDASLQRPPESTPSVGDPTRARERLGWHPRVSFEELVERMVQADLSSLAPAARQP